MLQSVLGIVGTVNITLQLIAAVAVIAAAFGIVNTMMAATYERKREIGILQALGARRRTIFTLFMLESGFYGLIGGLTGHRHDCHPLYQPECLYHAGQRLGERFPARRQNNCQLHLLLSGCRHHCRSLPGLESGTPDPGGGDQL